MDNKEITVDQVQQLLDQFKSARRDSEGFILLPSHEGFAVFQISKERLEKYLQIEELHNQMKDEQTKGKRKK